MTSGYCLMCDFVRFGTRKGRCGMIEEYYGIRDFRRFMREINYTPNGAGGACCKRSQKKRRRNRRRNGKWRRHR